MREVMAEELKARPVGGEGKDGGNRLRLFRRLRQAGQSRDFRRDRRLAQNQTGKRKAVIIIRERNGNSVPAV